MARAFDGVVVGSGPNGLAAAIELARNDRSVLVLEQAPTLGGGLRSAEVTLPGYVHDICAAVVPLTVGSPFLRTLPLADFGLELAYSEHALAHPLDDGTAVVLDRSVERTAAGLGADGASYMRLMQPLVRTSREVIDHVLGPLHLPRHPLALARFGAVGLLPATVLAHIAFRGARAQALLAGMSAHAILPLERPITAAFGLIMGMLGHTVGWPIVRGGSHRLAEALVGYLAALGGELRPNAGVTALDELPDSRVAVLDLTPRQALAVGGTRWRAGYRRQLARYRYGPGVCKVDWALDAPVPWTAPACRSSTSVHLGGTLAEIASGEAAVWRGEHPARPFVIFVQPTVVDPTRAPAGRHTAWAYCHVPNGSRRDMTAEIEAQVERFAPGFTARILARKTMTAPEMAAYNPNYVGGDINGGVQDLLQLWTRPVARPVPYSTPDPRVFLCSSSTPPGGGVHGMCGFHAARAALRRLDVRP